MKSLEDKYFFYQAFIITVPLYFFLSYIDIYFSLSAGASVEWKKDTTMAYPNVTVCFPKYFDSRLMEGKDCSVIYKKSLMMNILYNPCIVIKFSRQNYNK